MNSAALSITPRRLSSTRQAYSPRLAAAIDRLRSSRQMTKALLQDLDQDDWF